MKKVALLVAFILSIFATVGSGFAQDVSSLTGTVTDVTGAVVPGANVTLIDTKTNTTYSAKTTSAGVYSIPSVRPGPGYKMTFTLDGFQTYSVTDIAIGVGGTITQNAILTVGTSQVVEVSVRNKTVTLDTVDATIGNNLSPEVLNELPIQDRRAGITTLFGLQPGVTNGAVTGARTDQTETTLDGLDVNDIAAGQANAGFQIVATAPVDSVEEFRGTVAGQLASNGPGSGGQFQLVTRSGTNQFHGDLNEYHRDAQLAANSFFNKNFANPASIVRRPPLVQNQFGGAIGGPIIKDKLFFFFDFAGSRIRSASTALDTVPTDSYRGAINGVDTPGSEVVSYVRTGNFGPGGAACGQTSRQNTTPGCIGTLSNAQIAALDPAHLGLNQSFFNYVRARYPRANDPTSGNGYNTAGYRFNALTPDSANTYVGRLDYNFSSTKKFFARGTINRRNATQVLNVFPTDPGITNPFVDRSYSYVGGYIWQIGSNKVNQIQYGSTISKFDFPSLYDPTGTTSFTFGGLTAPFNTLSRQTRRVPIPELRDDFNWTKGSHQISFGGTFKDIKTHSLLLNDFNFPTVGLGGNLTALAASLRPADLLNSSTTVTGYDTAFATSLGVISNVSSNFNYNSTGSTTPQGGGATRQYRYYQTELYVGDTWKVNKQLTLTYGLRYQYYSVPFEATGNQSQQVLASTGAPVGFDTYFFGNRVPQSRGNVSGPGSLPFISYVLGGKANNGPGVYQPNAKDFAPRFSFAYNPSFDSKTVFNGGIGIVFDRTVVNAVNFIQDQSSQIFQQTGIAQPYGTSGNPVASLATVGSQANPAAVPRIGPSFSTNFNFPGANPAPSVATPYTPNVVNGVPNGLNIGRNIALVDPNLKDPYSIAYNFGVQRDIGSGFLLKVSYAGRLGRRLLAQADGSQIIDTADPVSGQTLSQAFSYLEAQARAGVPTGTTARPSTVTPQPFLEQVVPGTTQAFYNSFSSSSILIGGITSFTRSLSSNGRIRQNVGQPSQESGTTFLTNKGFSSYNGLLVTVDKNLTRGLRFDFNYTWSHSVDNTSLQANSIAVNNGFGYICDALNPRACRANSDFDIQNVINANFVYQLPFGHNRNFLATSPRWLDEVVGGWEVSGIPQYRSGLTVNVVTGAGVASSGNNDPAIFNGNRSAVAAHPHQIAGGAYNLFTNGSATGVINLANPNGNFSDPTGIQIGSRNNLRGPSSVQFDASLAKTFPIVGDRLNAKFRADAFNVLNHPVLSTPSTTDINSSNFGNITAVAVASRVLQVSVRLEF